MSGCEPQAGAGSGCSESMKRSDSYFEPEEKIVLDVEFINAMLIHAWEIYQVGYNGEPFVDEDCRIPRLIHGMRHITRVVVAMTAFARLRQDIGEPVLFYLVNELNTVARSNILTQSPEDRALAFKSCLLFCIYHDAAREGEEEDLWEKESAMFFIEMAQKCLGVSKELAQAAAMLGINKDFNVHNSHLDKVPFMTFQNTPKPGFYEDSTYPGQKPLFSQLVHDGDCLDIIRARIEFDIWRLDTYQYFISLGGDPKVNPYLQSIIRLVSAHKGLIDFQGDTKYNHQYLRQLQFESPWCLKYSVDYLKQLPPYQKIMGVTVKPDPRVKVLNAALSDGLMLVRGIRAPNTNKEPDGLNGFSNGEIESHYAEAGNPERSVNYLSPGDAPTVFVGLATPVSSGWQDKFTIGAMPFDYGTGASDKPDGKSSRYPTKVCGGVDSFRSMQRAGLLSNFTHEAVVHRTPTVSPNPIGANRSYIQYCTEGCGIYGWSVPLENSAMFGSCASDPRFKGTKLFYPYIRSSIFLSNHLAYINLEAIYLQQLYAESGIDLPIVEYSRWEGQYHYKGYFSDEEILQLWVLLIRENELISDCSRIEESVGADYFSFRYLESENPLIHKLSLFYNPELRDALRDLKTLLMTLDGYDCDGEVACIVERMKEQAKVTALFERSFNVCPFWERLSREADQAVVLQRTKTYNFHN